MLKKYSKYSVLFVLFLFNCSVYPLSNSYAGYWITYDGKSPHPRSIVKFTQKNDLVVGKNFLMFYTTDQPEKTCKKCGLPYRNKSLIGIPIFEGHLNPKKMKQPCKVYHTGDGRHFSCYFFLNSTGDILTIRVYVGLPLFGRTLKWRRISTAQVKSFHGKQWVRIVYIHY